MRYFICMAPPDNEDEPCTVVAYVELDEEAEQVLAALKKDVSTMESKYARPGCLMELPDGCATFFRDDDVDMPQELSSLLELDEPISFHSLLYGELPRELTEKEALAVRKCIKPGAVVEREYTYLIARIGGHFWEIREAETGDVYHTMDFGWDGVD